MCSFLFFFLPIRDGKIVMVACEEIGFYYPHVSGNQLPINFARDVVMKIAFAVASKII